ncbi:hypothetical protein GIB67_023603 [Kingdonia uniflora]|uniref:RING-type domain-containing protein n=1 Tax=Kingdonia uniflora TaxID=39325 RepID=A0A7J7L524_9MAGN|nr:hypothetical protein GIB67_023603 [Kingdonia uniflora]
MLISKWFGLFLILAVSFTIRYGYYGNSNLVLGPNTSRLLKASSVFVEQVQVKDDAKKGLFLYGFGEKPKLSLETKWNASKYLVVGIYRRKGFSLWLNKGSRISLAWVVHATEFNGLSVVLIKGEQNYVTVQPLKHTNSVVPSNPSDGNGKAEYLIEEDDSYYVSVLNMNLQSIIITMNLNVSSIMYDTTKATNKCSTLNGLCRFKLAFPKNHFVILTTPNNGDLDGWYIELSFLARLVTYVAILGLVVIVVSLALRYFGACSDGESSSEEIMPETENDPLLPEKEISVTYGTGDKDAELGVCSSSEDLYDGKICVICFDLPRNCFIVPCGHCATCYECALRVLNGENKVCPICRRFIHKVRKMFTIEKQG